MLSRALQFYLLTLPTQAITVQEDISSQSTSHHANHFTTMSAFEAICVSSSLSDPDELHNNKTSHFLKHSRVNPTFTRAHSLPPTTTLQSLIGHNNININNTQPPRPSQNPYHTHNGPSQQAQRHLAQRRWPAAFRPRRAGPCLRIPAYRRFGRGLTLRR